jgi:hypothetical protein
VRYDVRQGDLFAASDAAKLEAMQRADDHADGDWKALIHRLIVDTAQAQDRFTADDIWARYDALEGAPTTHDNRALGPRIVEAKKQGVCRHSGQVAKSWRRHSAPIAVWISLLRGPP